MNGDEAEDAALHVRRLAVSDGGKSEKGSIWQTASDDLAIFRLPTQNANIGLICLLSVHFRWRT